MGGKCVAFCFVETMVAIHKRKLTVLFQNAYNKVDRSNLEFLFCFIFIYDIVDFKNIVSMIPLKLIFAYDFSYKLNFIF